MMTTSKKCEYIGMNLTIRKWKMNQLKAVLDYLGTYIEVALYNVFADDGRRAKEDFSKETYNDIKI